MSIYSEISANKNKTYLIMGLFILFISLSTYILVRALGMGDSTVFIAFGFSLLFAIGSYYFGGSTVLALSGAKEMKNTPGQDVFDIVQNLSIAAGLPAPKVYLIMDSAPNAFATGRDPKHAVICVTSGLLDMMNKTELEGVIGHEMSHIKNFDTRLMVIVAVMVGLITILGDWFMRSLWWRGGDDDDRGKSGQIFLLLGIVFAILSPIVGKIIQLAISRKREFLADASAAYLTRYPIGLANALEKLKNNTETMKTASNATAHLFIVNPFAGKSAKNWLTGLFSTHPDINERIKILRSM